MQANIPTRGSVVAAVLFLTSTLAISANADELARPEGDIILTVSGNIAHTNGDGIAEFDMEMLEEIGATSFDTATIWTDGVQTFTGVEMRTLLDYLGAEGSTVRATAINDYAVDIPNDEIEEGAELVAYARNGEPMSVRDKGPLWVVYPFDSSPELQTEVKYSRSIWQMDRIEVLE
ncbi:molybdopterin-dependent oxidoreductase [Marivivens donghaensis]|uniref:Molybdopterin-dependent oxidoreductase n=1 Tax=Marivivens donghaensis TaxID=1699413 RepID=A0ABX0VSJ0_9RHOB|nr:molybdopterin-dependent oxidoreductase [Marivivens donghaensis]NIY70852.1 molybdopterin-dependent oxidoreductase [Marivivens donghaensis]